MRTEARGGSGWTSRCSSSGPRFDPATPYANTGPYTEDFPDGRMLTLDGWGHTILGKSSCADRRVADYLVHGKPPRDGAVCRPDEHPFDGVSTRVDEPMPGVPKRPVPW